MAKINFRDKVVHIFADSSGQLNDDNPTVLAIIFYFSSQIPELKARENHIKSLVNKLGISTSEPGFEFHAVDIFNKKGIWHSLDDNQVDSVFGSLATIILHHRIHYSLIAVNKKLQGTSGNKEYRKFISNQRKSGLAQFETSLIDDLDTQTRKIAGPRGIGPLGDLTSTLFGITTGYIDAIGFNGTGITQVDNEYFKARNIWPLVFQLSKVVFPILYTVSPIPFLPPIKQPKWHLGETVSEESSVNSFGIQLADFVAYTTAHKILGAKDIANNNAVIELSELHQFYSFTGISFGTSYRRYYGIDSHHTFQSSRAANKFLFNKTK